MLFILFNRLLVQYEAGQLISIIAITSAIVFFIAALLVFLLIRQRRNQEKHTQEKINMRNAFNQEMLITRLEIQEATFKTISQEIHDNIGQALSFVKLSINTVNVYDPEETRVKLQDSKNHLSKTIQDLRDLAKSLNTDFIAELGLSGAIEQQLQLMQKTGKYQTSLSINGKEYKDQQQDLVVFRIVQELLNNIVKHAEAQTVNIDMIYEPANLLITVKDDGKGFDTNSESNTQKGLGLANMRTRMGLINGQININSKPGQGTLVTIEVPKQAN